MRSKRTVPLPRCLVMAYLMDSHVLRGFLPGPMSAPFVQAYVCTCVWNETQESKCVGVGVCKEVWDRASGEVKETRETDA